MEAADESGVKVDIKSEIKYYAFQISDSHQVVKNAIDAMSKNDIKPEMKIITGGLDANNFNRNGIVTATLGVGCREAHTKNEYVIVKEMETMTKTLIDLIENLA
jgi:tripeptide aminopeptidase